MYRACYKINCRRCETILECKTFWIYISSYFIYNIEFWILKWINKGCNEAYKLIKMQAACLTKSAINNSNTNIHQWILQCISWQWRTNRKAENLWNNQVSFFLSENFGLKVSQDLCLATAGRNKESRAGICKKGVFFYNCWLSGFAWIALPSSYSLFTRFALFLVLLHSSPCERKSQS